MPFKELLSIFATVLTFVAFLPYVRSILRGETKPHVFSWVIWGSATFVVFLAQLAGQAGVGAWPIGISGIITLYIAYLAYTKKSDNTITRTDWFFFLLAATSLPLWYLTADPLWAVVILTLVDVLGFGPTIRKAYVYPREEQLRLFVIMMFRNLVVIAALEYYSITTVLFPAASAAVSLGFIGMVMYRRQALASS